MMGRKEAIKEYKASEGYAWRVRSAMYSHGQVWVGLIHESCMRRRIESGSACATDSIRQSASSRMGRSRKEAFLYELLEKFDEDVSAIGLRDL